jgi:hypothetical protein
MKYEKVKEKRETTKTFLNLVSTVQNIDVRVELIQSLTPLALLYAQRVIEDEVHKLERHIFLWRGRKKFFVLIDIAGEKKKKVKRGFYLTSEFYMICKKDGLGKMKIEKIGEKKEEFLEKLGECYSISTKNGTLSIARIRSPLVWRRDEMMLKRKSLFLLMERNRRIVLPELGINPVRCLLSNGVNEIGSDYLPFWRDKRTQFDYFKLYEIPNPAFEKVRYLIDEKVIQ